MARKSQDTDWWRVEFDATVDNFAKKMDELHERGADEAFEELFGKKSMDLCDWGLPLEPNIDFTIEHRADLLYRLVQMSMATETLCGFVRFEKEHDYFEQRDEKCKLESQRAKFAAACFTCMTLARIIVSNSPVPEPRDSLCFRLGVVAVELSPMLALGVDTDELVTRRVRLRAATHASASKSRTITPAMLADVDAYLAANPGPRQLAAACRHSARIHNLKRPPGKKPVTPAGIRDAWERRTEIVN
jgi:hypothetical protein